MVSAFNSVPGLWSQPAAGLPIAARIADVREENYRTRTLVLDCSLQATPGQFVMLWLPRFDEKPYSLVSADPITVMITRVGPFSDLVGSKRPGDRIWLRGPYGRGFEVGARQRHLALVGGGYGVAPLFWLAATQAGIAQRVTTIIGARTAADILFAGRFERLSAEATAFRTEVTTEDGSTIEGVDSRRGLVTDALYPLLEMGTIDAIFACGPHGMLSALARLARQFNVPAQLSWEAYMRCAVGICGACEHEGKLLCLDGPVLHA